MHASNNCVDCLIKHFESCRLKAYLDGNRVPTIGWGYTGPEVTSGLVWSQQVADDHLAASVRAFEEDVSRLVQVDLNQNQFDALVSLVYNIGPGNFSKSTVLRKLKAGDYRAAADAFLLWIQPGSVNEPGLRRRRSAERELFLMEP